MSIATASIRNVQSSTPSAPQVKQNSSAQHPTEFSPGIKGKKEETPVSKSGNTENMSPSDGVMVGSQSINGSSPHAASNQLNSEMDYTHSTSSASTVNGTMSTNGSYGSSINGVTHGMNGYSNGIPSQYPSTAPINNMNPNSNIDPTGPLPNEIFELLNEFWRPNDLVSADTHMMNGKFSRRSPEDSLDGNAEEEKEAEDDLTSLADTDLNVDRNTQKRRYSRLSDGYERLKSVLPSVKDKRRVSKARILDEAINYIQRLESITNVLKREHGKLETNKNTMVKEKRLSMLNGSNGFFPDYSMQPYMRSLFQKQMYPTGMSASKISQYPKMSTTPSSMPKSPRMKQYNQQYSSQTPAGLGVGSNMPTTDYNYNTINNYGGTSSMYPSSDPSQMMNGEASPIANNSPYSACSLSPGSTPTTYQNGSAVNNSWPYQGGSLTGYNDSGTSQLSSYSQGRNSSSSYAGSSYSSLNGNLWGSMGMSDATPQVAPHADHSMKVG